MEILKTQQWQGSKGAFDIMRNRGELVRGMLYFVGNSTSTERTGLEGSTEGVIYYALSPTMTVRFGTVPGEDKEQRVFDDTFDDTFGNSAEQSMDSLYDEINRLKKTIVELTDKINAMSEDLNSRTFG